MKNEKNQGYFPIAYYVDFLKFLHKYKSLIEVITYDDLEWGDDYNFEENYPKELLCWKAKLKNGELDKNKIYVLIQHDVDRSPELTQNVMEAEKQYGIRSNIMLFNRRVDRRHLQNTGDLLFDHEGYRIDIDRWKHFQKERFVFGYHANPFEQAGFDKEKALDIFESDVNMLRKIFYIQYFSPHGGARSPDGESNNSLTIPDAFKKNIRWVANGHTVRFDGVFSDGGPNSPKRDPSKRDLKDFVATWKPGGRYRVLTHPQYYCNPCHISERLNEAAWYREMQSSYSSGSQDYWGDACISNADGREVTTLKSDNRLLSVGESVVKSKSENNRSYLKNLYNKFFK